MLINKMQRINIIILSLVCLFVSCIKEDEYNNTPQDNFESLWKTLDEHYCFFAEKNKEYGLDWNEVHDRYGKMITSSMTEEQLFSLCDNMLRELRDGHVNIFTPFNTSRYWDWYEDYPSNFNEDVQRKYLGTDYCYTAGVKYRILSDYNIGYIYYPSFEGGIGSGNLNAIFNKLSICSGIIVDIRQNGGGQITTAQNLAECFTNKEIVGGYMAHKTGKGHDEFSSPVAIKLTPSEGIRCQVPVVVLTNHHCYSAANTFVMFMKACPNVTIVGTRTGGGGGMPMNYEMPNGWTIRLSACPMYDKDMNSIESGINPDIEVEMSMQDIINGKDTFIEKAISLLSLH